MYARKRLFTFLFAALAMLLCTACGRWDYSREAVKAANEAQGDTLRVEFKVNQTFTNALRAAVEDNIQPADVDKAMTMDKSIEKLLTSGYRLDVYALRADVDADQAAAQLADEFVNRLAGCEDEGFISMVKAENGYFYEAVLVYKHGGNGGSGSGGGSSDDDDTSDADWVTYDKTTGELRIKQGASHYIGTTFGYKTYPDGSVITDNPYIETIQDALQKNGSLDEDEQFSITQVKRLVIEDGSGITSAGYTALWDFSSEKIQNDIEYIELNGVTLIDCYAFTESESLKTAILPDVTTIKESAFFHTSLETVVFGPTVRKITFGERSLEGGNPINLYIGDTEEEANAFKTELNELNFGEGPGSGVYYIFGKGTEYDIKPIDDLDDLIYF